MKTWKVILWIVFFFPIGLYFLWTKSLLNKKERIAITIGFIILVGMGYTTDDNVMIESPTTIEESQEIKKQEDLLIERQKAVEIAEAARVEEIRVDFLKNHTLSITDFNVIGKDYMNGTSFDITIKNNYDKPIKYIYITVSGWNAVGDPVYDQIRGTNSLTWKIVGPLEVGQTISESFGMFYSSELTAMSIEEINIEFMDDSTAIIINENMQFINEWAK